MNLKEIVVIFVAAVICSIIGYATGLAQRPAEKNVKVNLTMHAYCLAADQKTWDRCRQGWKNAAGQEVDLVMFDLREAK
jgi:hypothetical protein